MNDVEPARDLGQRDFFRVKTRLPIRMTPVAASERGRLEREIMRPDASAAPEVDPDLARWLDRIERKLDRILLHLDVECEGVRPTETRSLVISGGGLRAPVDRAYPVGSLFLVELELPGPPAHLVRCLASVVEFFCHEDGVADLALAYQAIHEEDREAIVRHTLDVERSELRSRSARRTAS